MITRFKTLCCGLLLGLLAAPALAADAARLVSTDWLAKNLNRPDLVLIDASPTPMYTQQHIAGAVNADFFAYGPQEPTAAQSEQRFQSWGVGPGKTIVVYDQGGSYLATRVFFDLLYRGVPAEQLHVLDGGLAKWTASGQPVTKDPTPPPAAGSFRVTRALEELRVRLPEFLVASGDPKGHALIEALEPSYHYGEAAFFDRAGHVPYARMMPAGDFFNADKTFKAPSEIRRMLDHLGIQPEQQVHIYCGGGIAASVPFFAVKFLAGYPQVRLYQESQLEWLRDERGLPLWTYSAPYLLREAPWLKGWAGPAARMYGISRVSIVDVRAPDVYRLGHLPYALNVPAELFAKHLKEPQRLAELLGDAGVDPTHEAVVIADGGLTEQSALAFLALERLGQQRVSVLLPSTERWAELGHEVAREPTVVGPKKAPTDLAVPRVRYTTAAPRGQALVADPQRTPGRYPKVFVASGKNAPARPPEGTVVHLPYTSLLAADGQPKPAKDLWKALAKAGVPRYAEVVVFGDTVGEAAVNYVLLKLMGYADVKVWSPS